MRRERRLGKDEEGRQDRGGGGGKQEEPRNVRRERAKRRACLREGELMNRWLRRVFTCHRIKERVKGGLKVKNARREMRKGGLGVRKRRDGGKEEL